MELDVVKKKTIIKTEKNQNTKLNIIPNKTLIHNYSAI